MRANTNGTALQVKISDELSNELDELRALQSTILGFPPLARAEIAREALRRGLVELRRQLETLAKGDVLTTGTESVSYAK